FTNLIIVGPVLAFFIWLSLLSIQTSANDLDKLTGDWPTERNASGEAVELVVAKSNIGKESEMTRFIISIGLLLGGLMVSQQVAGAAAPGMGAFMGKIQKGATGAFKGVGMRVSGISAAQRTWQSYKSAREEAKKTGVAARFGGGLANLQDKAIAGVPLMGRQARLRTIKYADQQMQQKMARERNFSDTTVMEGAGKKNLASIGVAIERGNGAAALQASGMSFDDYSNKMGLALESKQKARASLLKQRGGGSAVYDTTTAEGRTQAVAAIQRGETSMENFSADALGNEQFMQQYIQQVKPTESQLSSTLGKLDESQREKALAAMGGVAQADQTDTPAMRTVKNVYAKETGDVKGAKMGEYKVKDPQTGKDTVRNQQKDYLRTTDPVKLAQTMTASSAEDAGVAASLAELPPEQFAKFLQNLNQDMRAALQKGFGAALDPAELTKLAPEEQQKVRERAMSAGVGPEKSYGYQNGLAVPETARTEFAASLQGSNAPQVVLSIPAGEIKANLADDIEANLNPAQFAIAARQAFQTGNKEHLAALQAIITHLKAPPRASAPPRSANAQNLRATLARGGNNIFHQIDPSLATTPPTP
ncbi:MAG: hypothetical protein AAB562_04445, partial [Patescibacteria group bacterium]